MAHPHQEDVPLLSPDHEDNTAALPPPAPPVQAEALQEDAPPPYSADTWANSRPIGAELSPSLSPPPAGAPPPLGPPPLAPGSTEVPIPSYESLNAEPSLGMRHIAMTRAPAGFGFTIFGPPPVTVFEIDSQGPSYAAGLRVGDRILEVNGRDATALSVEAVGSLVQSAPALNLIVVADAQPPEPSTFTIGGGPTGPNPWTQFNEASEPPRVGAAALSMLCCPLVGCVAVYYTVQARHALQQNEIYRSQIYSRMARKLMSCAVLYGILAIVLYLFARLGHSEIDNS